MFGVNPVIAANDWETLTTGAYCWFNNDAATYKATYGALYNWNAVADIRNIAPTGWHVPTDAEWTILTTFLGGESIAGEKMKEEGVIHWLNPNTEATNSSGFTATPAGTFGLWPGGFSNLGYKCYYWTQTQYWCRLLENSNSNCNRHQSGLRYGYSVRLVKD